MDWSNWTEIRDQSFPSCHFDFEPEIKYGENYWEHDFSFEEASLNEKACAQVQRILLGKENAELLKLEEDVTTLEKQLAWADVSWSELVFIHLSEKVKTLDLSIRNFKVTNLGDDRVFGESSLAYRELVERWMRILKLLPEKYVDQKTMQLEGNNSYSLSRDLSRVNDEGGKDKKMIQGTKADQSEKKKTDGLLDIQMNESGPLLDFINQKREQLAKRNPKDGNNNGSPSDSLFKTQKPKAKKVLNQTVKVECNLSDSQNQSAQNISFSITDARIEETSKMFALSASSDSLLKTQKPKAKIVLNQTVKVECNLSDFQNQSAQLQSQTQNLPNIVEEEKLKGLKHNLTRSLSIESLQNINFSSQSASTDLLLKSQKPKPKEVLNQKVEVEYNLSDPQNQSANPEKRSQSSPDIEKEEKKLKVLNYNPTQSSNINFSITDARMEETPKVLFSSGLPSATPGRIDFNLMKVTELRDKAKLMNLKGYWKLSKGELIEELNSKLANRGN